MAKPTPPAAPPRDSLPGEPVKTPFGPTRGPIRPKTIFLGWPVSGATKDFQALRKISGAAADFQALRRIFRRCATFSGAAEDFQALRRISGAAEDFRRCEGFQAVRSNPCASGVAQFFFPPKKCTSWKKVTCHLGIFCRFWLDFEALNP